MITDPILLDVDKEYKKARDACRDKWPGYEFTIYKTYNAHARRWEWGFRMTGRYVDKNTLQVVPFDTAQASYIADDLVKKKDYVEQLLPKIVPGILKGIGDYIDDLPKV